MPYEVILTKIHISMSDEDFEVSAWSHTGMLLAHVLGDYVKENVGFAYIEASTWVGRTAHKINLLFGADSKIKLPEKKPVQAKTQMAPMKEVPTTLVAIGGFEGEARRKCR